LQVEEATPTCKNPLGHFRSPFNKPFSKKEKIPKK
jgi:hypothetical protein